MIAKARTRSAVVQRLQSDLKSRIETVLATAVARWSGRRDAPSTAELSRPESIIAVLPLVRLGVFVSEPGPHRET